MSEETLEETSKTKNHQETSLNSTYNNDNIDNEKKEGFPSQTNNTTASSKENNNLDIDNSCDLEKITSMTVDDKNNDKTDKKEVVASSHQPNNTISPCKDNNIGIVSCKLQITLDNNEINNSEQTNKSCKESYYLGSTEPKTIPLDNNNNDVIDTEKTDIISPDINNNNKERTASFRENNRNGCCEPETAPDDNNNKTNKLKIEVVSPQTNITTTLSEENDVGITNSDEPREITTTSLQGNTNNNKGSVTMFPISNGVTPTFSSPTMNLLRFMFPQHLASISQQNFNNTNKKRKLSINDHHSLSSSLSQQQISLGDHNNNNLPSKTITTSSRGRGRNTRGRCLKNTITSQVETASISTTATNPVIELNETEHKHSDNNINSNPIQDEANLQQQQDENAKNHNNNTPATSTSIKNHPQQNHLLIPFGENKFRECFLCANAKNIRKSVKYACYQCVLPFCVSCFNLYHNNNIVKDLKMKESIAKLKKRKERSTVNLNLKRSKLNFDLSLYNI